MLRSSMFGLVLAALSSTALAQAYDPLSGGAAPAPVGAAPGAGATGGGMREYPVRTPVPANAVTLAPGVPPPPGKVLLGANMPGHRRFKPPLFPDAGWDSPLRENGDKFYDSYLVKYWRAPFLTDGRGDGTYEGSEQRGYIAPGPFRAKIARSHATAEEDAVFERRMQFITQEVLKARPLQNLYGASLEPELTVTGYGEQYGAKGDGIMRGQIELALRIIAPDVGKVERMPDGTMRSTYFGPTIRIRLNPDFIDCARPVQQTPTSAVCAKSDGRVYLAAAKPVLEKTDGGDPRLSLKDSLYADGRPPAELRALFVQHDRKNNAYAEVERGRMHPHDPLGRVIGVMDQVDWAGILQRANAIK